MYNVQAGQTGDIRHVQTCIHTCRTQMGRASAVISPFDVHASYTYMHVQSYVPLAALYVGTGRNENIYVWYS